MKAYKAFNQNLKCQDFQYEIGQTYEMEGQPILCKIGFHACLILDDVFRYCFYDPNTRICEVEILGDIIKADEDSKLATNKIKIVKEITEEVLQQGCRTIKRSNGIRYYKDYKFHREDGPAVENSNGYKAYYVNGQLHREDGPAVEYTDGDKSYYVNGELHREDGPAVEYANGDKAYYVNGQRHRLDGPAVEYVNGAKTYYINDKYLTEQEFNERRSD